MMIEHNLKPCPFCGGKISLVAFYHTKLERQVHMRCDGCGMEFVHSQDFATAAGADGEKLIPVGRSFEDIWNGRADK